MLNVDRGGGVQGTSFLLTSFVGDNTSPGSIAGLHCILSTY